MEDIYKAPKAELNVAERIETLHFTMSTRKLWVMVFATLGLYAVFWNYYHWRSIKHVDATESDIWPVARGIFSIFFVHGLFNRFTETCEKEGRNYHWNASFYAIVYIVFSIISNLSDRLLPTAQFSPEIIVLLTFLPLIASTYSMVEAQKAANISVGDNEGRDNSRFTALNILWIVVGIILWALYLLGMFMPEV